MRIKDDDASIFLRVHDFTADSEKLSSAPAFLLHHGSSGVLNTPVGPQQTVMIQGDANPDAPPAVQSDFLVFPVKMSGRSPFPHFISVGRTRNNDIVIADVSLSKFHAFFRQTADGMVLQDAGSRNGTTLNGERVPTQQEGAPLLVHSGAIITFGGVELTFLDSESFANMVKLLA